MEVVSDNAGMLSNQEVLSVLRETQSQTKSHKKHQQNLATLSYETIKYLEKHPCAWQSPENIREFMIKIQPFNLTKAEKLQLLNQRPTTLVEIQLMIEECEERLTEENVQEVLDIIATTLPSDPEQETDEQYME